MMPAKTDVEKIQKAAQRSSVSALRRRQPALPLEFASASSAHSFVVGHSNVEAWEFLAQRKLWPTSGLVVTGPASCGKTHLGVIWASRMGAKWAHLFDDVSPQLDASSKPVSIPKLVIDTQDHFETSCKDADFRENCEALFYHLADQESRGGQTLLLLRAMPPIELLPDLTSRLKAMTHLSIMEPDDTVLGGMLDKLLRDLGASVHPDAAATAARLMPRSGAAALKLAHALNEASLEFGRRITPQLVRAVLCEYALE